MITLNLLARACWDHKAHYPRFLQMTVCYLEMVAAVSYQAHRAHAHRSHHSRQNALLA